MRAQKRPYNYKNKIISLFDKSRGQLNLSKKQSKKMEEEFLTRLINEDNDFEDTNWDSDDDDTKNGTDDDDKVDDDEEEEEEEVAVDDDDAPAEEEE